jgi:hypothetical protein
VEQARWMRQSVPGGAKLQTASARPIWNPLLGNNSIKQLPLLEVIVAQKWYPGSHWSKNDKRSLLEDIVAQK